ncbi:MAG TPA: 5'-nucleotidase [Fimbriimonadaceae bacterium]|nr:5'-nucleotidase [Fimbriimonadaceae bacterium]
MTIRALPLFGLLALASLGLCQGRPGVTGTSAGQSIADAIRSAANTDGAFFPAGSMKDSFSTDNLASAVQYPADEIVIVRLTGSEIRQAFERSLSLYPQDNTSFLQVAGFDIEFSASGEPGKRVLNVRVNGGDLNEKGSYSIAMPSSLGRGGSGYFKIWDKVKITGTVQGATLESVLKGKRVSESKSRWVQR